MFADANYAGDMDRIRLTCGYVFNIFGGEIKRMSKGQSVVALSTREVEYMAIILATRKQYGYRDCV